MRKWFNIDGKRFYVFAGPAHQYIAMDSNEDVFIYTKRPQRNTCDDDVMLTTIPLSLYQVIVNLVMNTKVHAYGEDGGLVNIKVKNFGNHIEILVEDYGEGIPTEYQKKVFDPFFTTKRGSGGTGLGLNIVYNTVRQNLQGDIFFNSTEGKGTQFVVHLPL